jgi:hypothetical protein
MLVEVEQVLLVQVEHKVLEVLAAEVLLLTQEFQELLIEVVVVVLLVVRQLAIQERAVQA